jgi:hypothetical protein
MEQRYNGYVDALKQNDIPFQAEPRKKIPFDLPHDLSVQE